MFWIMYGASWLGVDATMARVGVHAAAEIRDPVRVVDQERVRPARLRSATDLSERVDGVDAFSVGRSRTFRTQNRRMIVLIERMGSARLSPCAAKRFPQYGPVADVIGEDENELAIHERRVLVGHVALAVDQLLVEAVGVRNVGGGLQFHRRLLQAFTARASARSIFAALKLRQRAATCWSGRIR